MGKVDYDKHASFWRTPASEASATEDKFWARAYYFVFRRWPASVVRERLEGEGRLTEEALLRLVIEHKRKEP